MKRFVALLLAALMLCSVSFALADESVDAFTSASVKTWYPDSCLDGQELVDAINAFSGFYVVATTNPDGTPNLAFVGFRADLRDDGIYLMLGMMDDQTAQNLDRTKQGVAFFMNNVYNHEEGNTWAGARMDLEVTEATSSEMNWQGNEGLGWVIWCKVTVRTIG